MAVWCTQNVCQGSSSFIRHQPSNTQRALSDTFFQWTLKTNKKQCVMTGYSHSFKITCNMSTVSMLESREQCCINAIIVTLHLYSTHLHVLISTGPGSTGVRGTRVEHAAPVASCCTPLRWLPSGHSCHSATPLLPFYVTCNTASHTHIHSSKNCRSAIK